MPPRTRSTAAKKDEPQVSVVDQLADDAAAVEMPTEYPPGAPALKPMLAIRPFSRRAEFKRRYAEVAEQKAELDRLQGDLGQHAKGSEAQYAAQLRAWAAMDEVFEKINNALRMAAVDQEAYDRWSDNLTDDNELMQVFNVYQQRTQPGEA